MLFILSFFFAPNIFAKSESSMSEQEVNERLKELGFTNNQIELLDWETKLDIASDPEVKELLGFSKETIQIPNQPDPTQPLRVIDGENGEVGILALTSSEITVYIVTMNLGQYNKKPYIKVKAVFDWNKMPFWRLTDGFAVSWGDGWYATSYSFTAKHEMGWDDNWLNASSKVLKDDRESGIGWSYDLRSGATDAKGEANIYLTVNDSNLVKNKTFSQFRVKYAHKKISLTGLSLSFGLSKTPEVAASITFSGSSTDNIESNVSLRNASLDW